MLLPRQREVGGASVQGGKPGSVKFTDQMPPTFSGRLQFQHDVKVERKMGENVPHGSDRIRIAWEPDRPFGPW